jgi:hypothetical protein
MLILLIVASTTVTVTISPDSTKTEISLGETIVATFSAAIAEPLSWLNLIKLQEDGTGDSLCTSVSYDSSNRRLTCGHDELDASASYTVTVAGVTDSTGDCIADTTETFSTSKEDPVTSVTKTTITDEDGGAIDVTFNFSDAISSSITPKVEVESDDDSSVSAGDCTMNGGRTSCTVTISLVAGCDTPYDYKITLSMTGYEDYVMYFNSGDNEFEDADTVDDNDCWIQDYGDGDAGDYDFSATGGNLRLKVLDAGTGDDERNIYYDLDISESKEGAFAVHVDSLDTLPISGSVIDLILVQMTPSDFDGLNGIMAGYNGNVPLTGWNSVYLENTGDDFIFGLPDSSGDLGDTEDTYEDFYICQTSYSNTLTTYISTDGENYIKLTEDNMECPGASTSCDLDQIDSRSVSSWDDIRLSIQVGSTNSAGDGSFYADFGFARFRTANLNGSMAQWLIVLG